MHLIPLYDKIVIEIEDKQEIKSTQGLVYNKDMSSSKNTTMIGKVIAVGNGRLMSDGTVIPLKVKEGDKIIYSKMQEESYNDGKKDYVILSESHILSILQEELDENN